MSPIGGIDYTWPRALKYIYAAGVHFQQWAKINGK